MAPTVLVTGFTGRLGRLVATRLRDGYGIAPRVLVREQHLSADDWQQPAGMQVLTGDYADPDTLDEALHGCDAVFLVSPVHPDMRARETALTKRLAVLNRSAHVVKISGLGTRLDSFVNSGRWHAEIERDIAASGLQLTALRPIFFMQNLSFQLKAMRSTGVLRAAVGSTSIAMVDARDIADVAARVLMGGSSVEGEAVPVTGGRGWSYEEVAAAAGEALHTDVIFEPQTLEELRESLSQSGQPDWHVDILIQFNQAFELGWGSSVSDTVQRVLGREPRTLEAFLREAATEHDTTGTNPFPS